MSNSPFPDQPFDIDRREHVREPVHIPVRLVLARNKVSDAAVVDRSLRGMRLRLAEPVPLPKEITIVDVNAGAIHEASVVWTSGGDFGVSLRSTHNIRAAAGPEAERLRRIWTTAVAR